MDRRDAAGRRELGGRRVTPMSAHPAAAATSGSPQGLTLSGRQVTAVDLSRRLRRTWAWVPDPREIEYVVALFEEPVGSREV